MKFMVQFCVSNDITFLTPKSNRADTCWLFSKNERHLKVKFKIWIYKLASPLMIFGRWARVRCPHDSSMSGCKLNKNPIPFFRRYNIFDFTFELQVTSRDGFHQRVNTCSAVKLFAYLEPGVKRLVVIIAILIFKVAVWSNWIEANHSQSSFKQHNLLLWMLRLPQIFVCITSCSNRYLSSRLTYPRYCSFLVLTINTTSFCLAILSSTSWSVF